MNITSTFPFVPVDDQLTSRWLYACQLQMEGKDWRAVAQAWMDLANACPPGALRDKFVYQALAGEAAKKAAR